MKYLIPVSFLLMFPLTGLAENVMASCLNNACSIGGRLPNLENTRPPDLGPDTANNTEATIPIGIKYQPTDNPDSDTNARPIPPSHPTDEITTAGVTGILERPINPGPDTAQNPRCSLNDEFITRGETTNEPHCSDNAAPSPKAQKVQWWGGPVMSLRWCSAGCSVLGFPGQGCQCTFWSTQCNWWGQCFQVPITTWGYLW